jgi:hypothetical protein
LLKRGPGVTVTTVLSGVRTNRMCGIGWTSWSGAAVVPVESAVAGSSGSRCFTNAQSAIAKFFLVGLYIQNADKYRNCLGEWPPVGVVTLHALGYGASVV